MVAKARGFLTRRRIGGIGAGHWANWPVLGMVRHQGTASILTIMTSKTGLFVNICIYVVLKLYGVI